MNNTKRFIKKHGWEKAGSLFKDGLMPKGVNALELQEYLSAWKVVSDLGGLECVEYLAWGNAGSLASQALKKVKSINEINQ